MTGRTPVERLASGDATPPVLGVHRPQRPAPPVAPSDARRRVLFLVNDAGFFLSHRLPLALGAADAGYEVHVAVPEDEQALRLNDYGFRFHPIPLSRWSARPVAELRAIAALVALYRAVRPDLVHHVAIKPVLYGSWAARIARVPAVVNAIPGLGYMFVGRGIRGRLRRGAAVLAYRSALRHSRLRLIFQNPDDLEEFVKLGAARRADVALIRGSGVDLDRFTPGREPTGIPTVVLPSRLLRDKGVGEFVAAARALRRDGVGVRCLLVGEPEAGNPAAISLAELAAWSDEGVIEWLGHRSDMPDVLRAAAIVCLPSYREGVPKVLLEAAATGRPIISTDVPGCREVVRDGDNGQLVPPRDAVALAAAIRWLVERPEERARMGRRSRERAEAEFGIEHVVRATMGIYAELLG